MYVVYFKYMDIFYIFVITVLFMGRCSSVSIATTLLAGWSGERIPVWDEIFSTLPDLPWGPPSLLYNGYRVFPGGNAAGEWCWPPTPSKCRGHERVELYLYLSSGNQWPVLGWTFTFTLLYVTQSLTLSRSWQYHFSTFKNLLLAVKDCTNHKFFEINYRVFRTTNLYCDGGHTNTDVIGHTETTEQHTWYRSSWTLYKTI